MVKNIPTIERSTKIRFGKNTTDDQGENTIVLNASNTAINASSGGSLYISPVRLDNEYRSKPEVVLMMYNTETKELVESGETASDLIGNQGLAAVTNQSNVTADVVRFVNNTTAFVTESNVGIANSTPEHTLSVGSNLYVDGVGSNVLVVHGNVSATSYHGDGSQLTGLVTTLQDVSDNGGNTTTNTIEFKNSTTGVVVDSNVVVGGNVTATTYLGDGSQLTGIVTTLQGVSDNGNTTSNTIQFTNATTSLVTTSNIEVGGNISVADLADPIKRYLPMVKTDGFFEKSPVYLTPGGTYVIEAAEAEFLGNITLSGNNTIVSSTSVTIEDRIFGIGANNEVHNLDTGIMMEHKDDGEYANVALIYHADEHRFSISYTQNTFTDNHILHYEDQDHQMLIDLRGNTQVQNNLVVGETLNVTGNVECSNLIATGNVTATSFIGDGSSLTGISAGFDPDVDTIAIGTDAGETTQGASAVAVGRQAGRTSQGINAVAVGNRAGQTSQGNDAVAMGQAAGEISQGVIATAVGYAAGQTSQATRAVAVGDQAGQGTQGINSVAVGGQAGEGSQGARAVSMGNQAGQISQGTDAVAVGDQAGQNSQGNNSVAVGGRAGEINQGSRAVAVGYAAGRNNQHDNSIVLNATSSFLDTAGTSRTYIKPLRAGAVAGNIMAYDSTSGEVIDYTGVSVDASSGLTVQGDISVSNLVAQNVETTNLTLDTLSVSATYTLQNVCDTGNTTSNTVQFTNPTTGLVTTSNLEVGGTLRLGTVDFVTSPSLGSVTGFGNTTPYTAEFNNVTTGLVTTSNAVIGGDLDVLGNLGSGLSNVILNATHPVGSIIDRATAITDTHPNGKYKAFLAAPNQEWELVDNGSNTLLEYLTQDGTTTSFCGRATLVPATGAQSLSSSLEPVTGTTITDFVPVLGTTKLKISCQIMCSYADVDALWHFRWQVKEGSGSWIDVTKSSVAVYSERMPVLPVDISMVFHLSDTVNDLSNGQTTSVRPTLNFRLLGRDYSNSHDGDVHLADYHFTVDNTSTHISVFRPPILDVISFGSETQAITYERTA